MRNKRKKRNSSGSNSDSGVTKVKQCKLRGPSAEKCVSISDVLGEANTVLYEGYEGPVDKVCLDNSVFEECEDRSSARNAAKMATGGKEPTMADLMDCKKGITDRLVTMERKLGVIEPLERRVDSSEKELKKVWVAIEDKVKRTDERVSKLEDKVYATDIGVALVDSRVANLEKQRQHLADDVSYLKAQSMRNNLIFTGIEEDATSGNEAPDVTERKLRGHLIAKLKIAKDTVAVMRFERVHGTPSQPVSGKVSNIVAKFTYFKDREAVRQQWPELRGTNYNVFEQFPPKVVEKRRRLQPKLKEAKRAGKRAWIAYDTLYIDGREEDMYICGSYIWGINSPVYNCVNVDLFNILENDINMYSYIGSVYIVGDLASRIGLKNDFIIHDIINVCTDDIDSDPDCTHTRAYKIIRIIVMD